MATFSRVNVGEATWRREEQHEMIHIIAVLDTGTPGKPTPRLQPLAEAIKRLTNEHTTHIRE